VVCADCHSSDALSDREPDLVVGLVVDAAVQTRERGLLGHGGEIPSLPWEEGGEHG
jgi:hypothetical protein